jgi:cytosine deaminase
MSRNFEVLNARLMDREGLWDLTVIDGRIASTAPSERRHTESAVTYDLASRYLLPGFVDVHVHLDKAFQLHHLDALLGESSGIEDALRATAELRSSMSSGMPSAPFDSL